jgi:hypothetical protein
VSIKYTLPLLFCLLSSADALFAQITQVYVFGSLHKAHLQNQNYSYQHLFDSIAHINPQIIGVEIRPVDISKDSVYLSTYYPYEMVYLSRHYPSKVFGFDCWETFPTHKTYRQITLTS